MEPIKVDFSDGGRRKSVKSVLIPPERAGLKIVINVIVMLLTAAIAYYFLLPPLNPHDYKFYTYIGIVLASYVAAAFVTSGAFAKPEYVPYVKRRATIPVIIAIIVGLVLVVGYLVSSPFFRAKSFSKILSIDNADFADTVSVVDSMSDFNNVALIDSDAAAALADKTLGDFAALDLESQFELLLSDSTQINFKGSPYRIYPLQYGDIFKWFLNSVVGKEYEGIPGYVKVNLNTQQAELVTDYDIKYSTAEHFGEYLERVLRFRYPTYIFGEISFEIDDAGHPFWVVEHIKKTVGLLGGPDVQGIILVDAVSGESTYYTAEETGAADSPIAWIDQAYDANLLIQQYNYFGTYNGGFWNSLIGQSGVKKTSSGYSFLAIDDDVYLYTGVTSVTSDDSILGFFFINQRTKEAFFYNTTGATEMAAEKSAEGKVQDLKWNASFPILLNIDGEATYFMALKDSSNIVKSFAMVNVEQYTVVAIPQNQNTDLRSCLEAYIKSLSELNPPVIIDFAFDSDGPKTVDPDDSTDENEYSTVSGTVTDIRSAVIGGTTYYYIELDDSGLYYYISAGITNKVMLLNVGDRITVTTADNGDGELASAKSIETTKSGEESAANTEENTET
ncbi:MAG: hypothetical protein IJS90_07095, partial [Clostridia bacterium]|nr:hypothetical protein [Clostridia bacterium]